MRMCGLLSWLMVGRDGSTTRQTAPPDLSSALPTEPEIATLIHLAARQGFRDPHDLARLLQFIAMIPACHMLLEELVSSYLKSRHVPRLLHGTVRRALIRRVEWHRARRSPL